MPICYFYATVLENVAHDPVPIVLKPAPLQVLNVGGKVDPQTAGRGVKDAVIARATTGDVAQPQTIGVVKVVDDLLNLGKVPLDLNVVEKQQNGCLGRDPLCQTFERVRS